MISGTDPKADLFLAALRTASDRTVRAQRQITSGYRINSASDDPAALGDVVQLRSQSQRIEQTLANLQRTKGEVDTSESALRSAVQIVERLRVIAVQGASGLPNAERATLAAEVKSLQKQLVRITATQVEGRYVFGGDADGTVPYAFDASAPSSVVQLTNSAATRQIEDAAGGLFVPSLTAAEIFDVRNPDTSPAPGNVFAAANQLRLALEADNPAQVASSVDQLRAASGHLNLQLSRYGVTQRRVDGAIDAAHRMQADMAQRLSAAQDTDLPAAILELQSAETQREVTLGVQAQLNRKNLFDYL